MPKPIKRLPKLTEADNPSRVGDWGSQTPLPDDEYGDAHMSVNPAYSRRTNMNIANQAMTDGNLAGLQNLYGEPGNELYPYTEGLADHGLSPQTESEFREQGQGLDSAVEKMRALFGDDVAAEVLDSVMREAAGRDYGPPPEPRRSSPPPPPEPRRSSPPPLPPHMRGMIRR